MVFRLGLLLVFPTLLFAQQRDSSAVRCTAPHTPDSMTVMVVAQLNSFIPSQPLPEWYAGLLLQEIATRLRVPQPFVLSVYAIPDSLNGAKNEPLRGHPGLHAMFAITVDDVTATPDIAVSSAVGAFDRAVLDAVRSTVKAGALPPLPESSRGKKLDLRLRLSTTQHSDSGQTLFRLRVPISEFSSSVLPKRVTRGPVYPEELRRANMPGSATVRFVIDETGALLQGSPFVVKADHLLFVESALEFLKRARYEPARIGGCPVAAIVQQEFNFALRP